MNVCRSILALAVIAVIPAFAGTIIIDDFDDNSLNPAIWTIFAPGDSILETNQRLEMRVSDGPPAVISTTALAAGNFDMQVNFQILEPPAWPPSVNVATLTYNIFGTDRGIARAYDSYEADLIPGDEPSVATSDLSGRLRLTRVGLLYSAYYWAGSDWALVNSTTGASLDSGPVFLGLLMDGEGQAAVAFDNFYMEWNISEVPEPSSAVLVGVTLLLLLRMKRRRSVTLRGR